MKPVYLDVHDCFNLGKKWLGLDFERHAQAVLVARPPEARLAVFVLCQCEPLVREIATQSKCHTLTWVCLSREHRELVMGRGFHRGRRP